VGKVENFLAQGMDAVVILPVDTSATGPVTKAVLKAMTLWSQWRRVK
jgi:ABC-type sugar transport system substrate-binding protein